MVWIYKFIVTILYKIIILSKYLYINIVKGKFLVFGKIIFLYILVYCNGLVNH